MKTYAVAPRGVLGSFSRNHLGYRFIPFCQHQPSRKHWLTPASALPRWARDATIVQAEDAVQALAAFTARS